MISKKVTSLARHQNEHEINSFLHVDLVSQETRVGGATSGLAGYDCYVLEVGFTFTYPVVWWTVGAPQMILQPAPSIVSVGDAEELSEASHLHGLYPSLCVCS